MTDLLGIRPPALPLPRQAAISAGGATAPQPAAAALPGGPVLDFVVYGEPAPQGSKRAWVDRRSGTARMVEMSKKVRPWRQAVAEMAMIEAASFDAVDLSAGPVRVELDFALTRRKVHKASTDVKHAAKRPDVDKLVRSTLDGITGPLLSDDGQVVDLIARKRIADVGQSPGVRIKISRAV